MKWTKLSDFEIERNLSLNIGYKNIFYYINAKKFLVGSFAYSRGNYKVV